MQQIPPSYKIRQANSGDISAVSEFMDTAFLIHRHLDWRPLMDWVEREPFLLRFVDNKITSLLSCAPDPDGVAWIHAFAADNWSAQTESIWRSLLEPAVSFLVNSSCSVFSVSFAVWYSRLLKASGFKLLQNIVVLHWGRIIQPKINISNDILVRPMELADLDDVANVDVQAFKPAWVISRESLERAYLQSHHANVAEVNARIVGYELSTANHLSAHLTRLAVLPAYTHAYIGYTLANEMLEYCTRQGIWQITVNTQDDNQASLSLYKKLGFYQTSDTFPVFTL